MSKNKKRPQRPKGVGNTSYMRGMQELRKSNAAGPHRPKNAYARKPKYGRYDDE